MNAHNTTFEHSRTDISKESKKDQVNEECFGKIQKREKKLNNNNNRRINKSKRKKAILTDKTEFFFCEKQQHICAALLFLFVRHTLLHACITKIISSI